MIRKTGGQNKIVVRFHKVILCFDKKFGWKRRFSIQAHKTRPLKAAM
jgi:hypothetical protein